MSITPLHWMDAAACKNAPIGDFFGPDGEREYDRGARETRAIAVCRSCPVAAACLDWALAFPSQHGVAGGLGEDQRSAIRHAYVRRQTRKAARAA